MHMARCRPHCDQATDSKAPGKAGEKDETLNPASLESVFWWWAISPSARGSCTKLTCVMSCTHKRGRTAVGCQSKPVGLRPSLTCPSLVASNSTTTSTDGAGGCGVRACSPSSSVPTWEDKKGLEESCM